MHNFYTYPLVRGPQKQMGFLSCCPRIHLSRGTLALEKSWKCPPLPLGGFGWKNQKPFEAAQGTDAGPSSSSRAVSLKVESWVWWDKIYRTKVTSVGIVLQIHHVSSADRQRPCLSVCVEAKLLFAFTVQLDPSSFLVIFLQIERLKLMSWKVKNFIWSK